MEHTVESLTNMIGMLEGDIEVFGPAGDDLARLRNYKSLRDSLIREAQEKTTAANQSLHQEGK